MEHIIKVVITGTDEGEVTQLKYESYNEEIKTEEEAEEKYKGAYYNLCKVLSEFVSVGVNRPDMAVGFLQGVTTLKDLEKKGEDPEEYLRRKLEGEIG